MNLPTPDRPCRRRGLLLNHQFSTAMRVHRCISTIAGALALLSASALAQTSDGPLCGSTAAFEASLRNMAAPDGNTVPALVVLVKFRDDNFTPTGRPVLDWPLTADPTQLPPFASALLDPSSNPATFRDSTLTRYFYEQSRPQAGSAGQYTLYGNSAPYVHVTDHDNAYYLSSAPSHRGYGYVTQEALNELFPINSSDTDYVYDPAIYDLNNDGVIDHIFVIIRSDLASQAGNTPAGCSYLGGLCGNSTDGTPSSSLTYYSPSRGTTVRVDWYASGSMLRGLPGGRWAYRPQLHYTRVMGHEIGHDLWGPHVTQNSFNDVPIDVSPTDGGNLYALMATNFSQHDLALAASERDQFGWVNAPALTTAGTVTLGEIYTRADARRITLNGGTASRLLHLANRQRLGYFNQVFESPVGDIGLLETDLLVTLANSSAFSVRDVIPASGQLFHPLDDAVFEGVMFGEERVKQQLTPWTRPNTSGFVTYPASYALSWQAFDNVRPPPLGGTDLLFEYYPDYRTAPTVHIRDDSWMGAEWTAPRG